MRNRDRGDLIPGLRKQDQSDAAQSRERRDTEYRRDGQGHQHPHTHRDRCNTCGGTGWRQCSVCWGRGTVTCGHCDGTGSLVIFTRLKISWENIKTESVVKESFDPQLIASLPDNKLSGADGPV